MTTTTDQTKITFLISLVKEFYTQGDSYYALKNKKGMWMFGYRNDYPMQHGDGIEMELPDEIVDILMKRKYSEYDVNLMLSHAVAHPQITAEEMKTKVERTIDWFNKKS